MPGKLPNIIINTPPVSRVSADSLVFVVPSDAPNVLYYHCGTHSGMGGKIEIYDDGQILIVDDVTTSGQWGVTVKDTTESSEQSWNSWMGDNLKTTDIEFWSYLRLFAVSMLLQGKRTCKCSL